MDGLPILRPRSTMTMIMDSGKSPLRRIHAVEMNLHPDLSLFRIRLAGVLPSSAAAMFYFQKHRERCRISSALKPAAPGDGRTPAKQIPFPKGRETLCGGHRVRVTE